MSTTVWLKIQKINQMELKASILGGGGEDSGFYQLLVLVVMIPNVPFQGDLIPTTNIPFREVR